MMHRLGWIVLLLALGCSSTSSPATEVVEGAIPDLASGGHAGTSGDLGGASTGGIIAMAGATGGEMPTGGVATGGEAGGLPTGGTAPECPAVTALTGLPGEFTWEEWSAEEAFGTHCAGCVTSPCGTATVTSSLGIQGATLTLSFAAVELRGGECGGEQDQCQLSGTSGPDPQLYLAWTPRWDGQAWAVSVDRSESWTNPQCYVAPGTDLEPWSRQSMLADLIEEAAQWAESLKWSCPA